MNLEAAIKAWRALLDEPGVIESEQELEAIATATFATTQKVPLALRPRSTADVVGCVRIAQEYAVPIYPVSRGRNWGLGSRVPVRTGSVVIELGRMDAIEAYDDRFGTVIVGPGVTFNQVARYLSERDSPFFLSVIGGSGEASVIGNVLERGDGTGAYAERADFVCAFEVVLADGSRVKTGFSAFEGSQVAHLCKWGVGPSLDGLFAQSNLGIVTRMTIWLNRKPRCFQMALFGVDDDRRFADFVDAVSELQLKRAIVTPCFVMNDYKQVANSRQYPWQASGGVTPLPAGVLESYKKQLGIMRWNGMVGLYDDHPRLARSTRALLKESVGRHCSRFVFLDERRIRWIRRLSSLVKRLGVDVDSVLELWSRNPLLGSPMDSTVRSLYWRKRMTPPGDRNPDRDRCGLYWNCCVVPAQGRAYLDACTTIERITLEHGLEPNIAAMLSTGYGRSIRIFAMYIYDRDVAGADENAQRCHRATFRALERSGYSHNRLDISSMGCMAQRDDDYDSVMARIRRALDPNGILAPGRYESDVR